MTTCFDLAVPLLESDSREIIKDVLKIFAEKYQAQHFLS